MASREEIEAAKEYLRQQQAPSMPAMPDRAEVDAAKAYLLSQQSPSFLETYAKTNQELNKKMARGVIGLPDLITGGAVSRGLKNLGVNLEPEVERPAEDSLGRFAQAAERVAGSGAEFVGGTVGGGVIGKGLGAALPHVAKYIPQAAKSIPYVSKPAAKVAGWTPGILGNPRTAKEAVGMTALGGGLGAGSGVLQEWGVPQAVADVGISMLPLGYGAAKFGARKWKNMPDYYEKMGQAKLRDIVGEENIPQFLESIENYKAPVEGYLPTTAEVTESIPLAQLERAKLGSVPALTERKAAGHETLHKTLKNIAPYEEGMPAVREHLHELGEGMKESRGRLSQYHNERATKAFENVGTPMEPEAAGTAIGERLSHNVEQRKALQYEKSRPHYEAIENSKEGFKPSSTYEMIDSKLEKAKGATRKALLRVKGHLKSNKTQDKEYLKELDSFNNFKATHPKISISESQMKEHFPKVHKLGTDVNPTPSEIDSVLTEIGDEISAAKRKGRQGRARQLQEVKVNLLNEVSDQFPDVEQARAMWAKHAEGIEDVIKHKTLKHGVEKDIYNKKFKTLRSEVPHKIIDDALKTPEHAREYVREIKGSPNARKATEGYIAHQVTSYATDASGKVIPNKIDAWKKANPQYETLYPGLKTRLDNLQNAQVMANETSKRSEKAVADYYNNTAKTVLGHAPEKVFASTLASKNPPERFRELKGLVRNNEAADKGLQRGGVDYIIKKVSTSAVDSKNLDKISYAEMRDLLNSHRESLKEVFSPQQMETIENIANTFRRRQQVGTREAIGSDTTANLTVLGASKDASEEQIKHMIGKSSLTGRLAHQAYNFFKNLKNAGTDRVINKAIVEPEYAKLLIMKPFGSKESTKNFMEAMNKSYLATPIITREYMRENE